MTDDGQFEDSTNPTHRGQIQAQGGGTEKSESWAQQEPPTKTEVLQKREFLKKQLTAREERDREEPLERLREFIVMAADQGGIWAPYSKTFLKRGTRDIRVDLEVISGQACVPDDSGKH